jgi:hypothetical protein
MLWPWPVGNGRLPLNPGMILTLLSYDVKTKVAATTNKAADSTKGVTIAFAA